LIEEKYPNMYSAITQILWKDFGLSFENCESPQKLHTKFR